MGHGQRTRKRTRESCVEVQHPAGIGILLGNPLGVTHTTAISAGVRSWGRRWHHPRRGSPHWVAARAFTAPRVSATGSIAHVGATTASRFPRDASTSDAPTTTERLAAMLLPLPNRGCCAWSRTRRSRPSPTPSRRTPWSASGSPRRWASPPRSPPRWAVGEAEPRRSSGTTAHEPRRRAPRAPTRTTSPSPSTPPTTAREEARHPPSTTIRYGIQPPGSHRRSQASPIDRKKEQIEVSSSSSGTVSIGLAGRHQ